MSLFEAPDPCESFASTISNRAGFHGLDHDETAGLLYFRNRWLDPEMGRFITPDPLGYVDAPNLYQAFGNNPANLTDPLGLYLVGGERELAAIRQVLQGLGEEDLAKSLRPVETEIPSRFRSLWDLLTFRKTRTKIEVGPGVVNQKHPNEVVELFRSAIDTGVRIEFSITDEPPHASGAKTSAQDERSGKPSRNLQAGPAGRSEQGHSLDSPADSDQDSRPRACRNEDPCALGGGYRA